MITLFHGTDNVSSRTAFIDHKDKDSVSFDAESLSLIDLRQALSGAGLFSESKKIFIENLFSKKMKNFDDIAELINKHSKALDFYLWEDQEISLKHASLIKNLKSQKFDLPKNLWTFLDNIRPGSPLSVKLFHKVLEEADENVIFSMIVRQFRLLLSVDSNIHSIDESKRMQVWQKSKLQRQARLFPNQSLKIAYGRLFEIDQKHKTGALDIPLSKSIDFFLAGL